MDKRVSEISAANIATPDMFMREICAECRPVVIRGLTAHWPAVERASRSPQALQSYLLEFDKGREASVFIGAPNIEGKYFYSDDLAGFNFERKTMRFADALDLVVETLDKPDAPTAYIGSVVVNDCLPGFSAANFLSCLGADIAPRIWIGHASNVSCHFDAFENIACVVAGERRFTLYPPECIGDLYVGPLDHTMAGQPVSLAAAADENQLANYPKFARAKEKTHIAELRAGDALFLPKLWWHQVEALSPFNCLVNYWWDAFRIGRDPPSASLFLAMIALGERPPTEREAWKAYFDHYVFRSEGHPLAHIPPERRGALGSLKENYGRLRAHVMQMLRSS